MYSSKYTINWSQGFNNRYTFKTSPFSDNRNKLEQENITSTKKRSNANTVEIDQLWGWNE